MLDFVINNWKLIAECVLALVILIAAIVRKRPVNDISSFIFDFCLKAVNIVESEKIVGSDEKLKTAIELVYSFLLGIYPNLKVDSYNGVIKDTIENILASPQKKEVK